MGREQSAQAQEITELTEANSEIPQPYPPGRHRSAPQTLAGKRSWTGAISSARLH